MVWGGVCGEVRCGVEWCRVVWFVVWCDVVSLSIFLSVQVYTHIDTVSIQIQWCGVVSVVRLGVV